MEPEFSFAQHQNVNDVVASGKKLKCFDSRRVQIRGSRIKDPANGKTCHQCRQKKSDFDATCNNLKKGKPCTITFCHECLLKRYGENDKEVNQLANWICPKCRDLCNCSICQKKRGELPTGPLYRNAKESGFKSVLEMLAAKKAAEALESNKVNDVDILPSNEATVEMELEVLHSGNANDVAKVCNEDDGNDNASAKIQVGITKFPNVGILVREKIEEEIPLPPGIELIEILGIELPSEDVGNALQLLEFCRVFGKALDLKEGEAEAMLQELVRKQNLHGGRNTSMVRFQITVLTLILNDSGNESPTLTASNGNNSWLKPLEDLITKSNHLLKDFPVDWLQEGNIGFYNLDLSNKLKLLNFLCDEALGTEKLRSYIQDENSSHAEELKETKSKFAAAKEKEKGLRQKLQNEMAKVVLPNVAPLPIEEHDAILSKMKSEVAQAHAEVLKLKGKIQKGKHSSDATRVKPEFLDNNDQIFWKLKSYNGENVVLLQDIKIQDETSTAPDEKWFVYGPEKKDEVDKYISSRAKKLKRQKVSHMPLQ